MPDNRSRGVCGVIQITDDVEMHSTAVSIIALTGYHDGCLSGRYIVRAIARIISSRCNRNILTVFDRQCRCFGSAVKDLICNRCDRDHSISHISRSDREILLDGADIAIFRNAAHSHGGKTAGRIVL